MLRNVLAGYIEMLTERQFDVPLLCILLKNGFYDIHFTHGAFEFGKDFIAKKVEKGRSIQYVFQSKGGNIGLSDWGQIRWQIEEARINPLSHPSFDSTLERRIVLITTGRLVGGAALSAQQYNERCMSEGQIGFIVWDIDTLLEMMLNDGPNSFGLVDETPELLSVLSKLKRKESNFKELECYSRYWIDKCLNKDKRSFLGVILESALFTQELNKSNRITLASYASLFPIRAILYALHELDDVPQWANECLKLAEDHFISCASPLLESLKQNYTEYESIFYNHTSGFSSFITYPVICFQIMEILSLLGLLYLKRQQLKEAEEIVDVLETLMKNNSGFFSPISDRYAVSIVLSSLLLAKFDRTETCALLIKRVTVWICNRYELSEAGLASPYATEEEEISTLLGYAYDFINLPRRRESYLATVLIDLAAIFGLADLYEDILNDILAVSILPCSVETKNTLGQYIMNGDAIYLPVVRFKEKLNQGENWRNTSQGEVDVNFCLKKHLWWELLSVSTVLRDRHYINELKMIFDRASL